MHEQTKGRFKKKQETLRTLGLSLQNEPAYSLFMSPNGRLGTAFSTTKDHTTMRL